MRDAAIVLATSVAGAGGAFVLAAADLVTGEAAVSGLLVYGPLGVFSAWLLWRTRELERDHAASLAEKDREHAAERESAWKAFSSLRSDIRDEVAIVRDRLDAQTQAVQVAVREQMGVQVAQHAQLVEIVTLLKNRP